MLHLHVHCLSPPTCLLVAGKPLGQAKLLHKLEGVELWYTMTFYKMECFIPNKPRDDELSGIYTVQAELTLTFWKLKIKI